MPPYTPPTNTGLEGPTFASPTVTVVVPARNEEQSIRGCLDSIRAQDWTDLEVLVVDAASDDGTRSVVESIAAEDPRVRVVDNPARLIPVGLNLALAQARGRWLVRVDAHASVPVDYVGIAVAHLSTERWGGVGGRKDGVGVTPAGHAVAAVMASRFGVGGSTYHFGETRQEVEHVPFGAYPVDLLRQLGGWDEELAVNQDFEMDYRIRTAGNAILFDPALRIDWECRQSVRALAKQYRRYGSGKVFVARKHPASLRPRHLAAPTLVVNLLLVLVLLLARRPATAAVLLAPYATALAGASWVTARRLPPGSRRFVAPAFVAMHVPWGVGFWEAVGRWALSVKGAHPKAQPPPPRAAGSANNPSTKAL